MLNPLKSMAGTPALFRVGATTLSAAWMIGAFVTIEGFAATKTKAPAEKPFVLTPEMVVQRIATASVVAKEAALAFVEADLARAGARAPFGTTVDASVSAQQNRAEAFGGPGPESDRTLALKSSVTKVLQSGTAVIVGYDRLRQNAELTPMLASQRTSTIDQNVVSLTVTQDLWRNAFGRNVTSAFAAADSGAEAVKVGAEVQLEALALMGLQLYWQAYGMSNTVDELEAGLKRLDRLLAHTKERARFGATTLGEVERVEADRVQQSDMLRSVRASFDQIVIRVASLLKIEVPAGGLELAEMKDLGAPPSDSEVNTTSGNTAPSATEHREIRLATAQLESARNQSTAATGGVDPKLALFGRAALSGLDEKASPSVEEMTTGKRPTLQVGLEFSMPIGDSSARIAAAEARVSEKRAELSVERARDNVTANNRVLLASALDKHRAAQSADVIVKLRTRAATELDRGYRQGRVGLDTLTMALNQLTFAEIDRTRAFAAYFSARDELAAQRTGLLRVYAPKNN